MATLTWGPGIGKAFVDALGLPSETVLLHVDIHLEPQAVCEVRCHFYPSQEALNTCLALMKRFHLVAIDETSPS